MKEFDLIPETYRIYIWKVKVVKESLLIMVGVLLIIIATYSAIVHATQSTNAKIEKLTIVKEVTSKKQEELSKLQLVKKDLDSKWDLLNGLRSTPSPEDIFYSIDNALKDLDLWFTNLKYERTEYISEEDSFINTGYFVILSADNNKNTLSIGTKLLISGGAANHSTLSTFVKNLLAQPSVHNAKVLETSTQHVQKMAHINYVIEIIINQNQETT